VKRILASLVLLLLAFNAQAANVTAPTGFVCQADADPNGTLTLDAGSNRKLLVFMARQNNTDPAPTITVDGDAPTETLTFNFDSAVSPEHWHYGFLWDEATIAAMGGSLVAYSGGAGFSRFWCYGVIEDTVQTNLTSFIGTDAFDSGTELSLTSTSSSGDLIVAGGTVQPETTTFTDWDTLTEHFDADIDTKRGGFASGNGGDTPTTVTVSTSGATSGTLIVFEDLASGPTISGFAEQSDDDTGIVFEATPSATGDADWAAYNKDEATNVPADCAAIRTHTGAIDFGTVPVTGSMQFTFEADVVAPLRVIDVYLCMVDDATMTDSIVYSLADQARETLAGYAIITDTGADGVDALSPLTPYSATANTTDTTRLLDTLSQIARFAIGDLVDLGDGTGFASDGPDVPEDVDYEDDEILLASMVATSTETGITVSNLVNELGTALINPALGTSDWGLEYELGTPGTDCDAMETCTAWDEDALAVFNTLTGSENVYRCSTLYIQHYGDGDGLLDAPFDVGHDICINNSQPTVDSESLSLRAFTTDESVGSVDIDGVASDDEGDTVTYLHPDVTLGTGLSYSSATGLVTGTPTVEDESGFAVKWPVRDENYLWTIWETTWYVITTWTFPNVVGEADVEAAEAVILAAAEWLQGELVTVVSECLSNHVGAAEGEIVAQDPAAMAEVVAYPAITLTEAVESACRGRTRSITISIGARL
jgi:hypothetical protein